MKKISSKFPSYNFLFPSKNVALLIAKRFSFLSRSFFSHRRGSSREFFRRVPLRDSLFYSFELCLVFFLIWLKSITRRNGSTILSRSHQTSHVGLSGIHGGCNSLSASPFGPSSLNFRVPAIFMCVRYTRASAHREPGNGSVGNAVRRESLLTRGENEVFHLTGVYTI